MNIFIKLVLFASYLLLFSVQAEEIGEVSTKFRIASPNDKITVVAFNDPDIAGSTCYLSRAKVGGFSGIVGFAEDTSDASIACRQTGKIIITEDILSGDEDGEEVFKADTSVFFKTLQVVRFYDPKRNVIIYGRISRKQRSCS